MPSSSLVLLLLASADSGAPPAVRCPVGGVDGGVVSITWSALPEAKQVVALSPSLRVLWVAYPGDPPAAWPEVSCVDGGVAVSSPLWLPFQLGFEAGGEALRVDLSPARAELDAAFTRLPGSSLLDARGFTRRAQHTAWVLRHLAREASAALQVEASDLELRERAWASPAELATALQFLSKTPRGAELAARVEERLVLRAPFVMRELRLLDSREGAAPPVVFWREGEPCVGWGGAARCVDPTTRATFATSGLERGDSLRRASKLVHTPPSTIEGEHDEATAVVLHGDREWTPAQLVVSARGGRFGSAPADVVFSPSRSVGVALVPSYGAPRCKSQRKSPLVLTNRFSCEATWRIESWEVWAFSLR